MTITAAVAGTLALDRCLTDIRAFIRRFVVLSHEQATTIALWIAHTHALEAADCTPYLQISSATKRAGKTRTLEVIEPLVARPWLTGRTSAAALVRKIDGERPTLLLDESDAAFGGEKDYAEALRGVLNTGYRRSGKATICVGQGSHITVRDFNTFCPKALAGIGQLPSTVADRAIPIALRRRKADEPCERWRARDGQWWASPVRDALEAAVRPLMTDLREARPALPDALGDRQCDCWEPLLALADAAGARWATQARDAALTLSGGEDSDTDITIELLRDLREIVDGLSAAVLDGLSADVLPSRELIAKLVEREDRPWATWKNDKPMTPRALRDRLKALGIHPIGTERVRGYRRDAFEDAFARYLGSKVSVCQQPNNDGPEPAISKCQAPGPADTFKSAETPITTGMADTLTHRSGGDDGGRF